MVQSRKIHLLLVDDEEDQLEIETLYISGMDNDIQITTIRSAEEALKLAGSRRFDCIVCDYRMPGGMGGLELCAELRRRGDHTPFVIFTGRGTDEVIEEAREVGIDLYLRKDSDPKVYTTLLKFIRGLTVMDRASEVIRKHGDAFL